MKISKDAQRIARQLTRVTIEDGRVNEAVVRLVIDRLKAEKPRGYLGILVAYTRLVRLELEKRHAVVESVTTLGEETRNKVKEGLEKKHGEGLDIEFRENPDLIGGMRVRVGSDVWDGSVNSRLLRLKESFS